MPIVFQHYAQGVNASAHPRLLPDGTLAILTNGSVTSGFCAPRPPFIQHQLALLDSSSTKRFGKGVVQGAGLYLSERGPCIILAADGYLFRFDLTADTLERIGNKVFSRFSERVNFCQRGPYFIAQDGISPPVVIRHKAVTQGTHPTRSVPCGTLMAEGWGRLAVASPCRTKIYFSNHIADPGTDNNGRDTDAIAKELLFTEDTSYFKNTRFFRIPQSSGKIIGMTFTPSLNGDGDLGPLAVFCEKSVWLYNTRVARESWGEQDIASNPLPKIGACSPDSLIVRGNDILFSDSTGRIQQMRIAVRRNDDARLKAYDANVWPLIEGDHDTHIHRRLAAHLPERHTLIAVHPEVIHRDDGRTTIRHKALLALNENPVIEGAQAIWDGEWTGVHPVAMIVAPWRGRETLFIVSLDSDGTNRIYRLGSEPGPDQANGRSCHQPMTAVTRADTSAEPFKPKSYKSGGIKIGNVSGNVKITGAWIKDGQPPLPWFTDNHRIPSDFDGAFSPPQDLPRLTPPVTPGGSFTDAAVAITIRGQARLEDIVIETSALPITQSNNVNPCAVTEHCRIPQLCCETYDLSP